MVEIFKTNVQEVTDAKQIIARLLEHFPNYEINFDLEDCDKILRVKAFKINEEEIISMVKNFGFIIFRL